MSVCGNARRRSFAVRLRRRLCLERLRLLCVGGAFAVGCVAGFAAFLRHRLRVVVFAICCVVGVCHFLASSSLRPFASSDSRRCVCGFSASFGVCCLCLPSASFRFASLSTGHLASLCVQNLACIVGGLVAASTCFQVSWLQMGRAGKTAQITGRWAGLGNLAAAVMQLQTLGRRDATFSFKFVQH